MFVRSYGFTVTEHDLERPWIITNTEHQTVELDDAENFFAWVAATYPRDQYSVVPDPWAVEPRPKS